MKRIIKVVAILLIAGIVFYATQYIIDVSFSGNEKVKIIENYESISSINHLVQKTEFKNKVLYIDIWGVHCTPCIKAFKYLPELKEKYKDKPLEFIYLAAPYNRFDDLQKWKSAIKKHNLQGYNALISLTFYYGIWEEVPEMNNPFSIPHYLIFDKNGNLINPNAPEPGNKKELYSELDKLL